MWVPGPKPCHPQGSELLPYILTGGDRVIVQGALGNFTMGWALLLIAVPSITLQRQELPAAGIALRWLAKGVTLHRSTTQTPTKLLLQEHAISLLSC